MSVSRRDFLGAGAAAAAGLALPKLAERDAGHHRPGPGRARRQGLRRPPGHHLGGQRLRRRSEREAGIQVAWDMLVEGRRPARCGRRRRPDRGARPERPERRPGRASERGGRRPARRERACTGRRSARARSGALEDVATPAAVASDVMDYTDHIMLVGAGAKKFALEMGFKQQNLLTEAEPDGLAALEVAPQLAGQLARHPARLRRADAAGAPERRRTTTLPLRARLLRRARRSVHVRHDQHERRDRQRRHRLGHDDERPVVEDPGPRRRLADHRRGPVLRQRRRRRRIDRSRRGEHQGLRRVPRRGVHAPGHVARSRRS